MCQIKGSTDKGACRQNLTAQVQSWNLYGRKRETRTNCPDFHVCSPQTKLIHLWVEKKRVYIIINFVQRYKVGSTYSNQYIKYIRLDRNNMMLSVDTEKAPTRFNVLS